MIADYFTKPLQGNLFKLMRNIIMGLAPFPDEERVNLGNKMSEGSHKNSTKASVERPSTMTTDGANIESNNDVDSRKEVTYARGTYADAVRTPSGKENMRMGISVNLVNPEGRALGRPSGNSRTRLIKI